MVATDRHTHTQTDRQTDTQTHTHTHRRHAKNNFFGFSGPQNVNIHQNLEVDFLGKCNTFSILRIAEKVKICSVRRHNTFSTLHIGEAAITP